MSYQRIDNVPDDAEKLSSAELEALGRIWKEKRSELEGSGTFREFLKKQQREWAIETGIIERLYTWDRGVTEVLIEQGIDASIIAHRGGVDRQRADHITHLIEDQLNVVEGLFSFVKGEQPLSEYYIRSLHAQFTDHQDTTEALTPNGAIVELRFEKGGYKRFPNNPKRPNGDLHEYCPPEFVNDEMQQLVKWYNEAESKYPPELMSAWLHHRFTAIHPFQDGNGRVARALASLVFLKAGLFPLVIRDADRKKYIQALEEADRGNLKDLVGVFASRQRESILTALSLQYQVLQAAYADEILTSALQVLKEKHSAQRRDMGKVYEIAGSLNSLAEKRLHKVVERLMREGLSELTPQEQESRYRAWVTTAGQESGNSHYFQEQIISVAKLFNYFADLDRYRAWVRLLVRTDATFEYVISFHGYGYADNGIVAVSSFTAQRVEREEGGTSPINTQRACTDFFQFNYAENTQSIETRFTDWLESSLVIALAEWKRRL